MSPRSWPLSSRPLKPFASAPLPPAHWSQVCLLPGFLPLCFHVYLPFYLFAAGVPNTFMIVLHFICLLPGFPTLSWLSSILSVCCWGSQRFHVCPPFYVCCRGSQHSAFFFVLHFIYMCMSSYLHTCCACMCMCVWVRTCVCLCTCVCVCVCERNECAHL